MQTPEGKRIIIGWTEPEIIWLRAANTLTIHDRSDALDDIAAMTGRGRMNIILKANQTRTEDRSRARAVLDGMAMPRRIMTACMPRTVRGPSAGRLRAGK